VSVHGYAHTLLLLRMLRSFFYSLSTFPPTFVLATPPGHPFLYMAFVCLPSSPETSVINLELGHNAHKVLNYGDRAQFFGNLT